MVLPFHSGVFMDRVAGFLKMYFPLLGDVFGKLMELSGLAHSLVQCILTMVGPKRAIVSVVLGYGGVLLGT